MGPAGGVVLGEQGHASFTILNEGALDVQYTISSLELQVSHHGCCGRGQCMIPPGENMFYAWSKTAQRLHSE